MCNGLPFLQLLLSQHLGEIKEMFSAGARVTLVVRQPETESSPGAGDVVIGDDDLAEAAAAIARSATLKHHLPASTS